MGGIMKCPNCHNEIKDDAKFCRYCGAKIETQPHRTKCPKCGVENRKDAAFCDRCGAKLSADGTTKDNSFTASQSSVSRKSSNSNNKNFNSAAKIENDASSNNTSVIVILAILFIIFIGGLLVFSNDTSSTITVDRTNFSIPSDFTEIEDYSQKDVEENIYGEVFYKYRSGFEDSSQENRIYIMVFDHKVFRLKDVDMEKIITFYDYGNDLDYKKETINGQDGFLIPKSEDAGYIMGLSEPVDIFVYEKTGDMILVGVTDESYFNEVIG